MHVLLPTAILTYRPVDVLDLALADIRSKTSAAPVWDDQKIAQQNRDHKH